MARFRRPVFLFFFSQDLPFLDVEEMLRGVVSPVPVPRLYALSAARGEPVELGRDELDLVLSLPTQEWSTADTGEEALERLARRGVVLSDSDEAELAELRRRDELLADSGWNAHAAVFHFLTRWRDVDLRPLEDAGGERAADLPRVSRESLERFLAVRGPPPPAFHALDHPRSVVELPVTRRGDGLFGLLARRKTTRAFDESARLSLDELSTVLLHVFGVHGYAPVVDGVVTLKRTSPSGGGLHPIEAYPLVSRVDGLAPGLYHYGARDHALELIEPLPDETAARALLTDFICGQTYFGSAHVAFVLAARFARNHWKYRRHQKAYSAMLMDAAHLTQTLYLVAAELGLGAFVTAAVNAAAVEERLGLDGYREGVLAVAGCGPAAARPSPFDPEFLPYVPRETTLPD